MSEEDNKKGCASGGSVVMVEKSASSRHKPYRPTELQDEPAPDLHKRSKAPAVPSLAEELKNITVSDSIDQRDRMECTAVPSEKHTHVVKNKSSEKRRGSTAEEIAMDTLEVAKDNLSPASPQPIPAHIETVVSKISVADSKAKAEKTEKTDLEKTTRADDDSITEEITELRTADAAVKDHSEWSDDEEAGGLPRSESRASRVSRVVRQLFCCGVSYTAPSEEDIPDREFSAI